MKNLLRDISAFLLDISEGGRHIEPSAGLCQNIMVFEQSCEYFERLPDDVWCRFEYFLRDWEHFSGDDVYPVPSTSKKRRPGIEYAACTDKTPDAFYKGREKRGLHRHLANEFRALTQTLQSDSFEGRAGKSAVCTGTAHPV